MRILRQKSQTILQKKFFSQTKSNSSEYGVKRYHGRSLKASVFDIIWEMYAFPLSILGCDKDGKFDSICFTEKLIITKEQKIRAFTVLKQLWYLPRFQGLVDLWQV